MFAVFCKRNSFIYSTCSSKTELFCLLEHELRQFLDLLIIAFTKTETKKIYKKWSIIKTLTVTISISFRKEALSLIVCGIRTLAS